MVAKLPDSSKGFVLSLVKGRIVITLFVNVISNVSTKPKTSFLCNSFMIRLLTVLLGIGVLVASLPSCTLEEDFFTDANAEVRLGLDTLRFDTVFTEVGSATKSFKIYNTYNQPLNLKRVSVENNMGGRFRINVDGRSGEEITEVFMPPNDSIYIFVEVTVDPDADITVSPYIFEGRVVIEATEQRQVVVLEAFGQNANYIPSDRSRANFGFLTCDLGEIVFDDPKPYVLYGSLVIDSCTLTLPPGCELYVHGGLVNNPDFGVFNDGLIIVQGSGRLNIVGSKEDPVLIATDRLEEEFLDVGGQFSGIRLGAGTGPHTISHARIRNGIVGVFVDSLATLNVDHTEISYTSSAGIVGYAANVSGNNVLIHSNGGGALQAILGGRYRFDYSTFVNYGSRNPAVIVTNGFQVNNQVFYVNQMDARFQNTIVYGSLNDEFALGDFDEPNLLNYQLTNCILKSTDVPVDRVEFNDRCSTCFFPPRDSALFVNTLVDSFQLDTLSVAEGKAIPLPGITDDLIGNERDASTPDVGAFEYQYE